MGFSVSCFGVLESFAATKNLPAARKNFERVDRAFTSFFADSREQITNDDRSGDDETAASPDHRGGAAAASFGPRNDDYEAA